MYEARRLHGNDRLSLEGRANIETPALMVDIDLLEGNIARIAGQCRAAGVNWRPHVKGVKVPRIVQRMLSAGAIGVTCAKLSEAEVMADAGVADILIANQVVGSSKIARLMALRRKCDVVVAVDNLDNIAAISAAASEARVELRVVIEVDIGIDRAGVKPGQPCLLLAEAIARSPALRFCGLMGWEGHAAPIRDPNAKSLAVATAVGQLVQSAELCRNSDFPVEIVSCGGTGTYWISAVQPGVTEIQAGGGVFGDVHYCEHYGVEHPYALTIMATVTSRPNPCRIICDAGKKAMSGDTALPAPRGLPSVSTVRLSAEHVTIELGEPTVVPKVGDQLEFVVGYSDTTVHLHEVIHVIRQGHIIGEWPVSGRGKIQ